MTSAVRIATSSCACCTVPKARQRRLNKTREPKVPADMVAVARPMNAEEERVKFFSGEEEDYEPQFMYRLPPPLLEKALRQYSLCNQVDLRFVPHAKKVLQTLLQRYGSYETYQQQCGGEVISEAEARPIVDEYLDNLGVLDEIKVVFDPNLVARASFVKRAMVLNIRPQGLRRNWVEGMLHHEIGTHYLRDRNDKFQPWAREKNGRRRYRLEDKNPTEEGLASLHTVLQREGHSLFRPALLYYATWRALELSFRDLYEDLAQFLGDSDDERWDYCVRAKRGLLDTSQPGGFAKDQCYLAGAMEILEQRRRIDFNSLYAGKISVVDSHRARSTGLARLEKILLPVFLQGPEQKARYMELLDEIVHDNGLSELLDGPPVPLPQTAWSSGGTRPRMGATALGRSSDAMAASGSLGSAGTSGAAFSLPAMR